MKMTVMEAMCEFEAGDLIIYNGNIYCVIMLNFYNFTLHTVLLDKNNLFTTTLRHIPAEAIQDGLVTLWQEPKKAKMFKGFK